MSLSLDLREVGFNSIAFVGIRHPGHVTIGMWDGSAATFAMSDLY